MPDSIAKIARGIDVSDTFATHDLDDAGRQNVADVLADSNRIKPLVAKATELRGAFPRRLEKIEATILEGVERTRQERERSRPSAYDSAEERMFWRRHDERALEQREAELRRELIASAKSDLDDMERQLTSLEKVAAAIAPLVEHPQSILSAAGLGLEHRTHLEAQLAKAGPRELLTFARRAAATGNKVLGAAVMHANDALESKLRAFHGSALAKALVGAEHQELSQALAEIRNSARAVRNERQAFETLKSDSNRRRRNANAKIAQGIAHAEGQ